jgi:hypothetical protein
MARRKKRTRRRFTGWNATNLLEGYLQANVLTEMAFRTSPLGFVFGNPGSSYYLTTAGAVSLKEIIDGLMAGGPIQGHAKTELAYVMDNIKANWLDGAIKSIGIGVGARVIKKLTSKPRASANRMLKSVGLGQVVRV